MLFSLFFAGALFCNSVPHLTTALVGKPFPTPFAKPRGIGDSSPLVNFFWGFANFVAGLFLLARHVPSLVFDGNLMALLLGGFAMGFYLARHFGKVQANKYLAKAG